MISVRRSLNIWVGIVVLLIVFSCQVRGAGGSVRRMNDEGNRMYEEERWEEALQRYSDAQLDEPENAVLHYNMGNVFYQLNDLEKAEAHFSKAATAEDLELAGRSLFNLGNTRFRYAEAMETSGNWQQRNAALLDSIASWRSVLELDESNIDAKFNLELARQKLLEEPPEGMEQPSSDEGEKSAPEEQSEENSSESESGGSQEEDQSGGDSSDHNREESQTGGDEGPQQEQGEEEMTAAAEDEASGEEDSDRGEEDDETGQADGESDVQKEPGAEDNPQTDEGTVGEPLRISPEEAERLLDALKDEELEEQRRQSAERARGGGRAEHDW